MLRTFFQKMPVVDKLYAMHLIVTGSAMVLLFLVILIYQYFSFKHDLLNDFNTQLNVVSSNVGAAVTFNDPYAATETLSSLMKNPSVEQVYLETKDHQVFAMGQRDTASRSINIVNKKVSAQLGTLHLAQTILVNQQPIAVLHLDANLSQVSGRILIFSLVLFTCILTSMLLAKWLSEKLNKYITDPIRYLEFIVTSVTKQQNYAQRSTIEAKDEIGALSNGINNMLETIELRDKKLTQELDQRKLVEQKLDYLAYFDGLTGLMNRHAFGEQMYKLVHGPRGKTEGFYLLIFDLDNFKVVNDTIGHEGGDFLLKEAASRLIANIDVNASIFRLGGDEFAITLLGLTSIHEAERVCKTIIRVLSQKFLLNNQEAYVGVSIGLIEYIPGQYNEYELIKNADAAMYWAKADGKNTYKIYASEIQDAHYRRQQMISMLQHALSKDELSLYFQPIVQTVSGRLIGFESLLRWTQPELGFIGPTIFVPLAESTGLIRPIGDWVIRKAVQQLGVWQAQYNPNLFMNINLSVRQFDDPYLVEKLTLEIAKHHINPETINLEITESILMDDVERAIKMLNQLRQTGFKVAVDDFGTGHSSMSYLKMFPINTLKIDKSFVSGVPNDKVDTSIIQSIFALAKGLNLDVVAEGVETQEQLHFLRENACAKVQGYLFSKPLPADQMEAFLATFEPHISQH